MGKKGLTWDMKERIVKQTETRKMANVVKKTGRESLERGGVKKRITPRGSDQNHEVERTEQKDESGHLLGGKKKKGLRRIRYYGGGRKWNVITENKKKERKKENIQKDRIEKKKNVGKKGRKKGGTGKRAYLRPKFHLPTNSNEKY